MTPSLRPCVTPTLDVALGDQGSGEAKLLSPLDFNERIEEPRLSGVRFAPDAQECALFSRLRLLAPNPFNRHRLYHGLYDGLYDGVYHRRHGFWILGL